MPLRVAFLFNSFPPFQPYIEQDVGNTPGGQQPSSAQNLVMPALVMWKHKEALKVTRQILHAVLRTEIVWRGDMLCCQSSILHAGAGKAEPRAADGAGSMHGQW